MLLLINLVSNRNIAAIVLTFQSIFCHTPDNFFRKLSGIIFGVAFQHSFKNNSLCTLRDYLSCRHDLYSVLAEYSLVVCRVITVTCKTVKLPDNDHIKKLFSALLNHSLKLRTVVSFGRHCSVYIAAHKVKSLTLRKSSALTKLSFNTLLSLIVTRISCINYCSHYTSYLIGFLRFLQYSTF